jgi:hypothetical protein
MTDAISRPTASTHHQAAMPQRNRPASAMLRGTLALLSLAILAGVCTQVPLRGDTMGLLMGVAGSLSVAAIVRHPERHPFLALSWSALAFSLPVAVTLAKPALALGLSLTLGSVGLWIIIALAVQRHLPQA